MASASMPRASDNKLGDTLSLAAMPTIGVIAVSGLAAALLTMGADAPARNKNAGRVIAPRGTRTFNSLMKSHQGVADNTVFRLQCLQPAMQSIANSRDDNGLQHLIDSWPNLPEAIKAGIVAMVKAAKG